MGLFFGANRQQRTSNLTEMIEAAGGHSRRGFGGSPVPVGWGGAQAIPAVLDAVRLRHDLIATMPVQVFRRRTDGRPEEVDPPAVLQQPEATGDIVSWLAASQKSLDMRGNTYGLIVDWDSQNLPTQIELQHPDKVQPRIDRDGHLYYMVCGRRKEPREVWHERCNEEPGSPVGLSPIGATARSLGINLAAEQFGSDFFRDGAHPTALLSSEAPLDEEQAKTAKRRFLDTVADKREPLVLGGNWSYEAMSVNPNEAQFLEIMRFGVNQVARIFNVLPELIGGGSDGGGSVTYANREQRALDFLTYRFNPAIVRRERALTRLTPRGQFVKLNRGALLATDLLTRYKSYELGLRNGFLALEEPRELEDRLPLTEEQIDALKDTGLLGKGTTPTQTGPAPASPTTES